MIANMNTAQTSRSNDGLSDETLMLRVLGRDQTAFRLLVARWKHALVNYFYRQLGKRETAEELAQEVFVKIWSTSRYTPNSAFAAWIWRLARNQLIDYLRASGRRPLPADDDSALNVMPAQGHSPEEALLAAEEQRQLQTALEALPGRQRHVLVLSKFQGLKHAQIAESLGCSVNHVKVQVFRAVQNLAKTFRELHDD